MAIFIVDQFSLNTDLPLDVRYVPSGGSYLDISAYWYPGMQVYQTDDQKIWYADNSLNWHKLGGDLDASVSNLYSLINDLSLYINTLDASIDKLFGITSSLDASIVRIDSSLNSNLALLKIHDASIGSISTRITWLETSVGYLNNWNVAQDASLALHDASLGRLDASVAVSFIKNVAQDISLGNLSVWNVLQDTSLGNLTAWEIRQDGSINKLFANGINYETSLGNLSRWEVVQDSSISTLRTNIESSLGLFVLKAGDVMTGPLTLSGPTSTLTVDGSSIFNGNAVFFGDVFFDGSAYFTSLNTLDISTAFINLNEGLVGPPPLNLQSGIIVKRGNQNPYIFVYDEDIQTFRIGISQLETSTHYSDSSTQAVATREDAPITNAIPFWNGTKYRFDTSVGLSFTNLNGMLLDASLKLDAYSGGSDLMLVVGTDGYVKAVVTADASINNLYLYVDGSLFTRDASITKLFSLTTLHEASLGNLTSWNANQDISISGLNSLTQLHEASLGRLDASLNKLFATSTDTSVLGAINIGDGSAQVFAGITNDGSLQFREIVGVGATVVSQNGDVIEISIDASFAGEVNTASNIFGGDASIFSRKIAQDLQFKSIKSLDPSSLIITSDASFVYFDLSIGSISATNASLGGLTDVSLSGTLQTHQIVEYDASVSKWKNTNNIWWDLSLGTTTNDFDGIPQGTNLQGLTLKEILYKILYEYQAPNIYAGSNPLEGIYEKGLVATQFASIDVSYYANNFSYPIAKLNNLTITKTGAGTLLDVSIGLLDSSSGVYTDGTGITNWGGTNRTINYNVYVKDDQPDKPSVFDQASFTFYYRQFWGEVDGSTLASDVNSNMIKTLDSSRLAGETDLLATFTYTGGPKIKYLFAYPDTVASPDNFGILSQIIDQNNFDISDSFTTENEDVSIGNNNVRYRFYLLNNKVDTSTFNITFKF